MKQCRTCGEYKNLADFPRQKANSFRGTQEYSYRPDCKICTALAAREYRKTYVKTKDKRAGVDKALYDACVARVGDAKMRAKKSAAQFDISTDWGYDQFVAQAGKCALTGRALSLVKGSPDVLSLDKKNPALGYTKDNTQWVTWAANRAKGDLSMSEFLSMCVDVVRCNDYPEREYSQAAGSATHS